MATPYRCAVCGTLALNTNSNLVDGQRFVHRACTPADEIKAELEALRAEMLATEEASP